MRHLSIFAIAIVVAGTLLLGGPQRSEHSGTGIVQDAVTQSETVEPLSGVGVRLVDPASSASIDLVVIQQNGR